MWVEVIFYNDIVQRIHFSVEKFGLDFAELQRSESFVREVNILRLT
jgi:hypothetical protein